MHTTQPTDTHWLYPEEPFIDKSNNNNIYDNNKSNLLGCDRILISLDQFGMPKFGGIFILVNNEYMLRYYFYEMSYSFDKSI